MRKNVVNNYVLKEEYVELEIIRTNETSITTIFSLEDYDFIRQFRWTFKYDNKNDAPRIRATTGPFVGKDMSTILLEGTTEKFVDHINRNTLDNRRENLRIVTPHQNAINTSTSNRNTTGILGVRIDERNKWESRLCVNGKNMRLGRFNTKEEAIIARLKAEKYYLGEFAPQKHLFEEYGI